MEKYLLLFLTFFLPAAACQFDKPAPPTAKPASSPPAPPAAEDSLVTAAKADSTQPGVEAKDRQGQPGKSVNESDLGAKEPSAHSAPGAAKSATPVPSQPKPSANDSSIAKNGFTDLATLNRSIRLDIRYATTDNFTRSKIYDCPRCLLRPEAAKAIVKAHKTLQKKGLGLKMFDCYRPRPYQQRLWDKVPNPDYVTPPAKGSMHSRGAAVDLTIVDAAGKELDMGTPYDFFGKAAHTDNKNLRAKVLANRRLLREALESAGFKGIRTEWWHFSFQGKNYPLSDYLWPCAENK